MMEWLRRQRLTAGLHRRGRMRSVLEVAQKREEFHFLYLQAIKKEDVASTRLAEKYRHYLDTLDWVLHAVIHPE